MSCSGLALNSSVTKLIGRTPCAILFILLLEINLKNKMENHYNNTWKDFLL